MNGRPLWFLGTVLGGWTAIRIALLWPEVVPEALTVLAPEVAASTRIAPAAPVITPREYSPTPLPRPHSASKRQIVHATHMASASAAPTGPILALAAPPQVDAALPLVPPDSLAAHPIASSADPLPRLSGSVWAIVRGGRAIPFASQLGGSQAGMRLSYAVDDARRLAIVGRLAGALRTRQQEAALGLAWRPTVLPIQIVAEQRFGIANARGGPALGLIGGIGPTALVGTIRIDAYAQGGAIARRGVEGFVDGAVRLSRPIATVGAARLDLELAAWGAAQRGAARLDAGPSAALTLPLAGRSLRISAEWRQRLAGDAAPASGPALAIGTDF